MIGSKRNDSSTIRAIPSASGEASSRRNFSINSSARSGDVPLARGCWHGGLGHGRIRRDSRDALVGIDGLLQKVFQWNPKGPTNLP